MRAMSDPHLPPVPPPHRLGRLLPVALVLLLLAPGPHAGAVEPEVKQQVEILEKNQRLPFEQDKRERAIRNLGKLGGRDAAAALLPVLEDPFVHLHDRAVSAWITMLRGKEAAETQTWLTGRALSARSPAVRAAAATALGVASGAEIQDPLAVALKKEKDGRVLAALARAARRIRGNPELGGALLDKLKHKDGAAVLEVAQSAAAIDGRAAVKPLLATLKHRAPLARAGAVLALQALDALPPERIAAIRGDKSCEPPMALAETIHLRTQATPWPGSGEGLLSSLLAHADWRVRAAAIQGALRIWDGRIVPLLIERLGAEDGRLQDDVRRALETFSGKAIGSDPDLWRSWWQTQGPTFDPGPRPEPDPAGTIRFRDGAGGAKGDGGGTVAFFDLPLRSKAFAFVFDLSGSMGNAAAKGSEDGPTKLDLLRTEMRKTLEALPPDTQFDLFVYRYWSEYPPATKLTRALGKLKPATPANVKKALKWLDKQEAKGWGAFYEPLEHLLADDVDSIVLLSDGRPSRGRYDRDFRILDEFPRANRFRRTAVNTILVGTKGADRKFMEGLAAATGGRFREAGRK